MKNNVFRNQADIILDDNFSLQPCSAGIQLRFVEIRQKKNKEGVLEDYEFVENYYVNKLSQALDKYVKLSQNSAKNLQKLIEKTEKIDIVLSEFKAHYKNW